MNICHLSTRLLKVHDKNVRQQDISSKCFLTTASCSFLIPLSSLLFFFPSFSVTAFISSHHCRVVTGYSTIGNTYLHREVVRTPVIRPSRISIFRWTECLRYWQSRRLRLIVNIPRDRTGGFCAAVRVVNSSDS